MKLLVVVLAIGFFLLAGAPLAVVAHPVLSGMARVSNRDNQGTRVNKVRF